VDAMSDPRTTAISTKGGGEETSPGLGVVDSGSMQVTLCFVMLSSLLFLFSSICYGIESAIPLSGDDVYLGANVFYLADDSDSYADEDVIKGVYDGDFQRHHKNIFTHSSTATNYWFRVKLRSDEAGLWIIALRSSSRFAKVSFYQQVGGVTVSEAITGRTRSPQSRAIAVANFAFPVNVAPGGETTLYFSIQSESILTFDPHAYSPERFLNKQIQYYALSVGLLLICAVVIVYTGFAYLTDRDPSYVLLVVFVLSFGAWYFDRQGLDAHLGWWLPPALNGLKQLILALLFVTAYAVYTYAALDVDAEITAIRVFFQLLLIALPVYLLIACAAYPIVGVNIALHRIVAPVLFLFPLCMGVLAGVRAIFARKRYAGYYLTGLCFLFLGLVSDVIIQTGARVEYVLAVAFSVAILLFSRTLFSKREGLVKLVRLKEQAEEDSRAKSEFLSTMSHELRTPLNAILGFSELMREGATGALTETQIEFTDRINESGSHLLALVDDVLDLTKLEAGKMELDVSDVDMAVLIKDSLVMVKEQCQKKNIGLELELDPAIISVTLPADERKLKQVMYNLLSNAIKFTPDVGEIRVQARLRSAAIETGEGVVENIIEVVVQDNGIGIAPKQQERLFDKFYQVKNQVAGKTMGTGLGLPLSLSLVELHGGTLRAESAGPGQGSSFIFTIPLRP
jgi:signal transduction histidine kinase